MEIEKLKVQTLIKNRNTLSGQLVPTLLLVNRVRYVNGKCQLQMFLRKIPTKELYISTKI